MSDIIRFIPKDETHVVVRGPLAPLLDLHDHLTFPSPGREFNPAYKAGFWDGMIHLFSPYTPVLYKGLVRTAAAFLMQKGHEVEVDPKLAPEGMSYIGKEDDLIAWASDVTNDKFEDRGYQMQAFAKAVIRDRCILLSSTSSGKTLMMYRIGRFYRELTGKPALFMTTRTNLVTQMAKDFESYSPDELKIHTIKGGVERDNWKADYVVSTWQSAAKQPPEWFDRFSVICADEAHNWDAKKLTEIISKAKNVKYRFGFSGTLKGTKNSEMSLVGSFGPILRVSKTKERIEDGSTAALKIIGVQLSWPEANKKEVYKGRTNKRGELVPMDYAQEMNYIITDENRQNKIVDYVDELKGNALILFNRNDAYGKPLFEKLQARFGDRAMLVYGETDDEARELVRTRMEETDDVVALASLGTFSEGFSVNNLRHVVLAYPLKSRVRLMQSVGRVLRKSDGKVEGVFHDFADDLRYRYHENYSWRHFMHRLEIYRDEELGYEMTFLKL